MAQSEFCQLFEKIIENIIESRYIGIFQIIGKLSILKLDCQKISVIWGIIDIDIDIEIDRKIIEKLSLSKKMTYRWPLDVVRTSYETWE